MTVRFNNPRSVVLGLAIVCLGVSGCHVGPAYRLASVPTAPAYKEADPSLWKPAAPKDTMIRGKWWEMFGDPQLDALEERVNAGNQNIAAAAARYDAARAMVRERPTPNTACRLLLRGSLTCGGALGKAFRLTLTQRRAAPPTWKTCNCSSMLI